MLLLASALPASASIALFADGRTMKIDSFKLKDENDIVLTLKGGGAMTIPLTRIDRIVDDEIAPPAIVAEVKKIVEEEGGIFPKRSWRYDAKRGPIFRSRYDSVIVAEVKKIVEEEGGIFPKRSWRYDAKRGPIFRSRYDSVIVEAAKKFDVDAALISAVIKAESDFNPREYSNKGAPRREDRVGEPPGRAVRGRGEEQLELVEAERLAVVVLRLDDPVREVDHRIAFLQVDLRRVRADLAAHAERQRRHLDRHRRGTGAQQVRIEMPGIRVADAAALEVEDRKGQRHERAAFGGTVDEVVQAMEERRLVGALFDQRRDRRLHHGHDQAGRQPVAGDVADRHRQARLVEVEDVVVVAADRRRRLEVRGERHAAELRPFLRQEVALDRRGDLDLALQALLLGDVGQQRGDRLRHAVERQRHLAELVARLHVDAVAEVAALDRLRPLLDAVDGARDREDQHRREERRDHVEQEQQNGEAERHFDEDADVAVGRGAEVVDEEVLEGIDDRGEEIVRRIFLPVVPPLDRAVVEPDDLPAGRAQDEVAGVSLGVDVDAALGAPRLNSLSVRADAHGHAAVILDLRDPLVVHRLHEDHGARRRGIRDRPRRDEQRHVLAPGHAAERSVVQPFRQCLAAVVGGVVDLQRLERVCGAPPGHAVLARGRLQLPEKRLALAAERSLRHHAGHHVGDRDQQASGEEKRKDTRHDVAEEEAPPDAPEELAQRPAHRHGEAVHAEGGEDERREEDDEDEEDARHAAVAQPVGGLVDQHEDDEGAEPDQPQHARPPALGRRCGGAVDRQWGARAQHGGVIRDLSDGGSARKRLAIGG